MLLFLSLTQFMGAITIILFKIAFKNYLSSLSLILTWPIRSELFTCALPVKTHYLLLDGMVNIPMYLVWASWVRSETTFLSDNRYFEIQT